MGVREKKSIVKRMLCLLVVFGVQKGRLVTWMGTEVMCIVGWVGKRREVSACKSVSREIYTGLQREIVNSVAFHPVTRKRISDYYKKCRPRHWSRFR